MKTRSTTPLNQLQAGGSSEDANFVAFLPATRREQLVFAIRAGIELTIGALGDVAGVRSVFRLVFTFGVLRVSAENRGVVCPARVLTACSRRRPNP